MKCWPEVREWRRSKRTQLITRRGSLSKRTRAATRNTITSFLADAFPVLQPTVLGFYWPYKGEVNLRPFVSDCIGHGAEAALPVVVERGRPLEFWRWTLSMPLQKGIWNIPIPRAVEPVAPSVLLVPLVGFDEAGYRLGHGGGYYDRTLAGLEERPFTIGVGYEFQRLPTIHPQPHDIPMDCILTEAGYALYHRETEPEVYETVYWQSIAQQNEHRTRNSAP